MRKYMWLYALWCACGTAIQASGEAINVSEADFGCVKDLTSIRHFYVGNVLGDASESVAAAQNADGGLFPVGTILQQTPTEAMIKREEGFNPETNDWEFFTLRLVPIETPRTSLHTRSSEVMITQRGGAEVVNQDGRSCLSCHQSDVSTADLICGDNHSCQAIGRSRRDMRISILLDPRCESKPLTKQDKADLFYLQHKTAEELKQKIPKEIVFQ